MVATPRSRRRWLWLVPLVLVVVALVAAVAAVITLRVAFNGSALASRVCARLDADMRGRVAIASIDWPISSVPTVATGGWVPVVLRDVQIRDTDGVVVLRSPQIRAELDVHALLFGHHDVLARRVVMDGGEIVVREVAERQPAFEGDTTVSLIAAFEPRVAPRAGAASARAGAKLELRDAEVRRTTVVIDALPIDRAASGHELHASVADVSARGSLAYDPRGSPARLVFQAAPRGGEGTIVVRGRSIAIASVDVRELAQADTTITFAAEAALPGGELVRVDGALRDYWPTGHFGRDSRLAVTVSGLHHTIAAEPPVVLDVPPLVATHDLHTGEGQLAPLVVRGAGAGVMISARWGGGADGAAPTWFEAPVATEAPIDLAPWMRPDLRREFGHTLRGKVTIRIDGPPRGDGLVHVGSPDLRLQKLHVDAGTLVLEGERRLRLDGLHYRVPGLEGTYDCTIDPGPPLDRSCDGSASGDVRVLLRLRKLDTW